MEKIPLPAADVAALVPRESLLRSGAEEGFVELEADLVLAHIVPHISLAALSAARPDLFSSGAGFVRLPAWLLAKTYRVEEETCDAAEQFAARPDSRIPQLPSPVRNLENFFHPPVSEPPPEILPEIPAEPEFSEPPAAAEAAPQAAPQPAADQPQRLIELIQSLPTFHRFNPAATETVFLEIEPCGDGGDLPDQHALQSLFLTEETLTVRRVVELCGELPGIRSCVVTHGEMVVSAHNLPEGFDPVSLSATATRMLEAMGDSASQLGIGEVPALTLHTSSGPLSVVRQGALSMLVVHDNRGFIPGVREKITAALFEMARAPLALPRPADRTAALPDRT
jgi:predicted regulator of Ras-like GTPase activity (Roadblock/LC7/MglB family)